MKKLLALVAVLAMGISQAQEAGAPAAAAPAVPTAPPAAETTAAPAVRPARPARPSRTGFRPAPQGQPRSRGDFGPGVVPMERMKQAAAELRELYDQDKDGQLSADEKAFMERDLAEADRKARLSRDYMRIKAVDVDGNLVISPEEEAGSQQRLREDARNRIEALQRQRARQAEQQQKPDTKAPAPAAPAPAAPAPAAPAPAAE